MACCSSRLTRRASVRVRRFTCTADRDRRASEMTRVAVVTGGGSGLGQTISEHSGARGPPGRGTRRQRAKLPRRFQPISGRRRASAIAVQVDVVRSRRRDSSLSRRCETTSGQSRSWSPARRLLGSPASIRSDSTSGIAIWLSTSPAHSCACKPLFRTWSRQQWGRIVTISSAAGQTGLDTTRPLLRIQGRCHRPDENRCAGIRRKGNHRQHRSAVHGRHPDVARSSTRQKASAERDPCQGDSRRAAGHRRGHRGDLRVLVLRLRGLHHRPGHRRQWRGCRLRAQRQGESNQGRPMGRISRSPAQSPQMESLCDRPA